MAWGQQEFTVTEPATAGKWRGPGLSGGFEGLRMLAMQQQVNQHQEWLSGVQEDRLSASGGMGGWLTQMVDAGPLANLAFKSF